MTKHKQPLFFQFENIYKLRKNCIFLKIICGTHLTISYSLGKTSKLIVKMYKFVNNNINVMYIICKLFEKKTNKSYFV